MLNNLLEILIELKNKLLKSRLVVLGLINAILIFLLVIKLYNLQIINGESYVNNYIQKTERTTTIAASRGNIYDSNGELLAYNELAYKAIVRDNGDYKNSNDKNLMLYKLVNMLREHGERVVGDLQIALLDNGEYEFTSTSEAARKRFLRDYYGLHSVDELDDKAGKYPSSITADKIIEDKLSYYGLDKLKDDEGSPIELTSLQKLDLINIRYTMSFNAYKNYEATTVAENISNEAKVAIEENADTLLGVEIEETTKRVYNNSIYFSSILGYTGIVQEDQLEQLQAINPDYNSKDIVGRTGIEQYMETELQGKKGSRTMYVDNLGHIMEITSETKSEPGHDVYLTIDSKLQIGIYHLLEQHLAGVLATKLVNEDNPNTAYTDSTARLIPIKDAYFQLINNNVLSMDAFYAEDASSNEQEIASITSSYKKSVLAKISRELSGDENTPLSELPEDIYAYIYYIYNHLSSDDIQIVIEDQIDKNSDYYKKWVDDSLSFRDYLYYGISDNWIDSTKLASDIKYSDSTALFDSLIDYINTSMSDDTGFNKLLYKHMINQGLVTGRQLCIALFDQEVLEKNDEELNALYANGDEYAYTFFKRMVSTIKLTPAQLALDPCTAGCVVTDVNTGEVKALVSYPGYDNNRLANTMDTAYYNQLLNDQSLPLYNNATQARKAPGSTFKPITAVAALEEGIISPLDTINCTGIYDEIEPPLRCWIYPGFHGSQTIVEGIKNSCNYFFADLGHRLSMDENEEYSADLGIERLRKYITLFGLDHKSGVEINETDPIMTNTSPEQSAIGQGTNAYSNIQLSRYVTAIANKGNVYELSLIDKTTDFNGNTLMDYSPQLSNHIDVKDETWNTVQSGMRAVIEEGSASQLFSDLEVNIAGKTGTAQESKARANHAFFISFGPFENPQVAVTVNIPYGYSSSNAASIAKDVYRLNFGYTSLNSILNSNALDATNITIGD